MKISVLMVTYNHERYIERAVESVIMQQGDFDLELVIGEDRSTDRTRAILSKLTRKYPQQINLICSQENIGPNRNYIRSLRACEGKYVAILDGDDYWTAPDKLECQIRFLETHPDCSICYHNAYVVYESGNRPPHPKIRAARPEIVGLQELLATDFMPTCSVMYRNGLVGDVPDWYFVRQLGDWPLHIFHAEHGDIGYIDRAMATYRIHPSGIWGEAGFARQLVAYIDFYQAMQGYLGQRYRLTIDRGLEKAWSTLADELFGEAMATGTLRDALVDLESRVAALLGGIRPYPGWKESLESRVYMAHAFLAFGERDLETARYCWRNAVRIDKSWLKNRGVLSVGRQAWVSSLRRGRSTPPAGLPGEGHPPRASEPTEL